MFFWQVEISVDGYWTKIRSNKDLHRTYIIVNYTLRLDLDVTCVYGWIMCTFINWFANMWINWQVWTAKKVIYLSREQQNWGIIEIRDLCFGQIPSQMYTFPKPARAQLVDCMRGRPSLMPILLVTRTPGGGSWLHTQYYYLPPTPSLPRHLCGVWNSELYRLSGHSDQCLTNGSVNKSRCLSRASIISDYTRTGHKVT